MYDQNSFRKEPQEEGDGVIYLLALVGTVVLFTLLMVFGPKAFDGPSNYKPAPPPVTN
jgi:hypothetical protein